MFLLDKIFEILAEGSTLGSPVLHVIMERVVVLRSRTGRIMLLRFQTLQPGLILDGFEDVLDREL